MENTQISTSVMSLLKSSVRFFKQNYKIYLPVLVILYVLTILRIPVGDQNDFSLLSLVLQLGYLYFLIGFMKLVINNVKDNEIGIKNIIPNVKIIIRPIVTLISLVATMVVIYLPFIILMARSFIKNINNGLLPKDTVYSLLPTILIFIILVLLTSFILNSTLMFSIKNNTWPLRSVKDFFKATKGKFLNKFWQVIVLTFYMLCSIIVIAFVFTLFTFIFKSEYISTILMLAIFQVTIFPIYYICFTKIILPVDDINHNLPEIQPLEVNAPIESSPVGQNI